MIEIKRHSNQEKFEIALKKVSLRFPVAEIASKTGYGKSQVSKILKQSIPISDEFLQKFINGFNIVFTENELNAISEPQEKYNTKTQVISDDDPFTIELINKLFASELFKEKLSDCIKKEIPNRITKEDVLKQIESLRELIKTTSTIAK